MFILEDPPPTCIFNRNVTISNKKTNFSSLYVLVIVKFYKELQNHGSALYHSQYNVVLLNQWNYILHSLHVTSL